MKKDKIISAIESIFPKEHAEPWDNSGLIIDADKEDINKIYLSVDLLYDNINELDDVDMVITHHPLIFNGIKEIDMSASSKLIKHMIKHDIVYYSAHSSFDIQRDGFYKFYEDKLNLKNTDFAIKVDDDLGYGIAGELNDMDLMSLAKRIKTINMAKYIQVYKNNDKNTSIMILNGSGKDFLDNVLEERPDTLITSDLGYHDVQALRNAKINLIMQDHNSSESAFVNIMEELIKKDFEDSEIIKNFSSFTDNIEIL